MKKSSKDASLKDAGTNKKLFRKDDSNQGKK